MLCVYAMPHADQHDITKVLVSAISFIILLNVGQYIAPKKAARAKSEKLKKVQISKSPVLLLLPNVHMPWICLLQQLTKQIGERIEQELHQRAASAGNEFRILSRGEGTSQPSTSTSKGGKKKAASNK